MCAHLAGRVLGTSSPLDARLTVLQGCRHLCDFRLISAMSFCQACGTKVFESAKYCHNCGAVADSFQNGKLEDIALNQVHVVRLFDGVFNLFVHSFS